MLACLITNNMCTDSKAVIHLTNFAIKMHLRLHEPSCDHLFQKAKSIIGTSIGEDFSLKKSVFTELSWARMGNIYSVKHSQSWNLEQAQSEHSMNPQPGVKYILFWPYHLLNKYNILTCSLPDIPYDALWKTTSIWWLIIFLKSYILVISPENTHMNLMT